MRHIFLSDNHKKGDAPLNFAIIVVLLGEMAKRKTDYREVLPEIDITPKKSGGANKHLKYGGDRQQDLSAYWL